VETEIAVICMGIIYVFKLFIQELCMFTNLIESNTRDDWVDVPQVLYESKQYKVKISISRNSGDWVSSRVGHESSHQWANLPT